MILMHSDYEKAVKKLKQAQESFEKISHHRGSALCLKLLSDLHKLKIQRMKFRNA
jgi:hypothetical protein